MHTSLKRRKEDFLSVLRPLYVWIVCWRNKSPEDISDLATRDLWQWITLNTIKKMPLCKESWAFVLLHAVYQHLRGDHDLHFCLCSFEGWCTLMQMQELYAKRFTRLPLASLPEALGIILLWILTKQYRMITLNNQTMAVSIHQPTVDASLILNALTVSLRLSSTESISRGE